IDVTEQTLAEQALRQAEERYRLAAKASNDAIWDWDAANDRLLWNEMLAGQFGHDPADITTPAAWAMHIHPDDRERVFSSFDRAINGTVSRWSEEYRFRCADGRYAEVFDRGFL